VTRRIFLTIVAVTTLAVVLFGVPLAILVNRRIHDDAVIELQRAASAAAVALPRDIADGRPIELPGRDPGLRLALYDAGGRLVAGSGPAQADPVVLATADGDVHDGVVGRERVVAMPLPSDVGAHRVVRAAEPRSEVRDRELRTWLGMVGLGVFAVGLAAVAGALLARRLSRPVVALRDASVRLGEGDFTLTAPHSGIPELDDAAAALTTTAHRLGATIERERAFAADASHQLRTPLASLRLAVENELVAPRPDPTVALHDVLRDVDRLDETVTSLLALARETSRPRDPVEVDGLVREAAARWQRPVNASGRMLRVDVTRRVAPVLASPMAVATILDVLLDNALHHGSGGISISVAAAARSSVAVVVEDEGTIGVPDGALFARRSSHARDHGIGLALARSLAEAEGLRLVLATRQPTAFELILPGTA